MCKGGDHIITHREPRIRKIKGDERKPGEIVRRTEFKNYMNGHGTFYAFNEEYFPKNLLEAKQGEHLKLILYNLNTDQFDEVIFELTSKYNVGEKFVWLRGHLDDLEDYFEIKIDYNLECPLESYILVFGSAPPYYG